jgi:hypothetical protein
VGWKLKTQNPEPQKHAAAGGVSPFAGSFRIGREPFLFLHAANCFSSPVLVISALPSSSAARVNPFAPAELWPAVFAARTYRARG